MTARELDAYFRSFLNFGPFVSCDVALNGLQVANSGAPVHKVAFAVDACAQSIDAAARAGARMLFVHHGLFWGRIEPLTGMQYRRVQALLTHDIALYAVHLPLDAHPQYGNNAGLAARVGLRQGGPFGFIRGTAVVLWGTVAENTTPSQEAMQQHAACTAPDTHRVTHANAISPSAGLSLQQVVHRLFPAEEQPVRLLPFGKQRIERVGILSGKAGTYLAEAIALDLDLFITGEIEHSCYHTAREHSISVIAGGHYQTETVGLQLVARKLQRDTGIETLFLDIPTGM